MGGGEILPGCYFPGCDQPHHPQQKFCPQHGGRAAAHSITCEDCGRIVTSRQGEARCDCEETEDAL